MVLSYKVILNQTAAVVKETFKRSIVSRAIFEKYVNINDEALSSDATTDEDIIRESQNECINEIETDSK